MEPKKKILLTKKKVLGQTVLRKAIIYCQWSVMLTQYRACMAYNHSKSHQKLPNTIGLKTPEWKLDKLKTACKSKENRLWNTDKPFVDTFSWSICPHQLRPLNNRNMLTTHRYGKISDINIWTERPMKGWNICETNVLSAVSDKTAAYMDGVGACMRTTLGLRPTDTECQPAHCVACNVANNVAKLKRITDVANITLYSENVLIKQQSNAFQNLKQLQW